MQGLSGCEDVILLSFFDGVGSAALALRSLDVRLRATLEWEIDQTATAVSTQACRCLRMKRGDLTADDRPAGFRQGEAVTDFGDSRPSLP